MAAAAASAASAGPAGFAAAQVQPTPAAEARPRYPGVRSFGERDQALFRGRRAASEELLLRVLSVRLLLQFAPSGVGKTSLLAAGLFPRLRQHDYFPFFVRLNEPRETLVQAVHRSLLQAAAEQGLVEPVVPPQAHSLWALLSGLQLWSSELLLLTPVLVFDQFEEVFTLRDAAFRADFAQQVGELTGGLPRRAEPGAPGATEPGVSGGAEPGAYTALPTAKFVLSLREEYLGKLEELSAGIPDLFRERLRLPPLTAAEARAAIVEPAALPGDDWASPAFGYTEEALALALDFIDGASQQNRVVEPLTLQLVCQHAERVAQGRRAAAGPILLTAQDFGGVPGLQRLVREHYWQVLQRLAPAARRRAQRMFEEGLLDPAGKRLMLEQGEIEREFGLDAPTLDKLVASRLLRREPRNESVFYEISHDRLTETIAKHRRPRLPRWVLPTLAVGALFLALAIGFGLSQRRLAEEARAARDRAESVLGQLLGERLVQRLHEGGLADALRDILGQANDEGVGSEPVVGLSQVLWLRHAADIERDRGTLSNARERHQRALAALNKLPTALPGHLPQVQAERARIERSLGELASDAGDLARALGHLREARRLWEAVLAASSTDRPQDMLDTAESELALATLLIRQGDYDEAEALALGAGRLAADILTTAYDGRHGMAFDASYDIGRAMQVFADAALILSKPRSDVGMADVALNLGREAVRLRPLSFHARKQLGTAIAYRFSLRAPEKAQEWQVLLVEGRRQFDDLGQVDAQNLRMRRERAALELLIADVVAICVRDADCRRGLPSDALREARRSAVQSTGVFRELAADDDVNRSLQSDVAWGLGVQAQLLAIDQDPAAAVRLDEAIALRSNAMADPSDYDELWARATLYLERAKVSVSMKRPRNEAKAALDAAWAALTGSAPDTVGVRFARIALLEDAVPLLRKAGLPGEAKEHQARLDALEQPGGGPSEASRDRALEYSNEALDLSKNTARQDVALGRANRARMVLLHQRAVGEYPFDANMWSWLRLAHQQVADDDAEAAEVRDKAWRSAVAAAWLAQVLEPGPRRLQELIDTRRGLAQHLRDRDDAAAPESLALAERSAADTRQFVRLEPDDPKALFYLVDASFGVAFTRENRRASGWDEAFRLAFLDGQRLIQSQPNNAAHLIWLGKNRSYYAGLLERDQRPAEAAEERRRALAHCKAALAVRGLTGAQRDEAQACIADLSAVSAKK